jgi:hypothetical protein
MQHKRRQRNQHRESRCRNVKKLLILVFHARPEYQQ